MKSSFVSDRFKLIKVDRVAYSKGYRAGQVVDVWRASNAARPERGPLLLVRYRGLTAEGFYLDQMRPKPRKNFRGYVLVREVA